MIRNPDEKHAAHEKFANYRFDKAEFLRIAQEAVHYVRKQLKARAGAGGHRVHDEM